MKRRKTEEMEAGKELDALIAEKVMGCRFFRSWAKCKATVFPSTESFYVLEDDSVQFQETYGNGEHGYYNKRRFSPSTDIADAWEVIGKFQREDFKLIWWNSKIDKYTGWHCELKSKIDPIKMANGRHHSNPAAAICLAALQAVGYRQP